MTRPSQARGRRGLKVEAEQLARRGRPPKDRPPAPAAPAPGAAPATAAGAVAGAPPEDQGKQFGLVCRSLTAPIYLTVCGAELPEKAWEEWGIAAMKFAAYYAPAVALHPGYQFVAATAMLAAPVALAWPAYAAKRRAALAKAKAEAAAGQGRDGPTPPAAPTRPAPPARPGPGHSVGDGWSGAARD